MTATPGHLQRAHTFNNGQRLDVARASLEAGNLGAGVGSGGMSPGGGTSPPIQTVASTPAFSQRTDDKYNRKFHTANSQTTLLTLSRIDGNGVTTIAKPGIDTDNNYLNRNQNTIQLSNAGKVATEASIDSSPKASPADKVAAKSTTATAVPPSSTLSTIAEKLRRGTKKVLLFKNAATSSQTNVSPAPKEKERKLEKGNSVDSAHTNTISNSSLQEVDDDEFESAELAKYMGQVNSEIR